MPFAVEFHAYPSGVDPIRQGNPMAIPARAGPRSTLGRVRLDGARSVVPYLYRHGRPIAYGYLDRRYPLEDYQTTFAAHPGSAVLASAREMASSRGSKPSLDWPARSTGYVAASTSWSARCSPSSGSAHGRGEASPTAAPLSGAAVTIPRRVGGTLQPLRPFHLSEENRS